MNHLQETARHYANLAEQYRTELAEEQELNEDLLGLVDALCEELGIDVEALLEMPQTPSRHWEMHRAIEATPRGSRERKKLARRDVMEKESEKIFGTELDTLVRGRKGRRGQRDPNTGRIEFEVGKQRHMAGAEYEDWWARDNADAARERREQEGVTDARLDADGKTPAERATHQRLSALKAGARIEDEKRRGIKQSIGRRIRRAVDRLRGRIITPHY
jgi:hypothetical protein